MLKIALCVLVLASLSACHAPERAEVSSVAPLGARSGHSFTYLDEAGVRQTALLAGIRGAETPDSREQLQRLLDEAGPALMLIEIGVAKRARYLKRGGWVTIDYDAMQDDDFRQRILDSYATVRKGLTKAQKAALLDIPDQPPQ